MTPVQFSCKDAHKHIFGKQPTKIKKKTQQMANV
jgi:hypothetical protein